MKAMNHLKFGIFLCLIGLFTIKSHAQLTDGMTGLLHMPNAEVQKDASFMIGGNLLHKNNIPSKNPILAGIHRSPAEKF